MSGNWKKIVSLTLITFMGILQAPAFAKSFFHPLDLLQRKPTFNVPKKYDAPQLQGSVEVNSEASISWRQFFLIPILST